MKVTKAMLKQRERIEKGYILDLEPSEGIYVFVEAYKCKWDEAEKMYKKYREDYMKSDKF